MSAGHFDPQAVAAPGVLGLKPYEPGKPIEELEREYGVRDAIKLASNENPLGPGSAALEAVRRVLPRVARYPDGNGFALKEALAQRHGIPSACITLGNGSNDVLELVGRTFLRPGDDAVYAEHAFVVYALVTQAVGARHRVVPARDWGHDLPAMAAAAGPRTRVAFIANPNNPTGTWLDGDTLAAFLDALPDHVVAVVDEAYFEYVDEAAYPDCTQWLDRYPNLVVTRTFSKIHGLAGLRVGYALSSAAIADLLNRVRQPFNCSLVAQEAALAALGDEAHVAASCELNRRERRRLIDGCRRLHIGWIPSQANFVTIEVGDDAVSIYESLLREGVIVRPLGGYGMPRHLRVTVGVAAENERFLEALERTLSARRH